MRCNTPLNAISCASLSGVRRWQRWGRRFHGGYDRWWRELENANVARGNSAFSHQLPEHYDVLHNWLLLYRSGGGDNRHHGRGASWQMLVDTTKAQPDAHCAECDYVPEHDSLHHRRRGYRKFPVWSRGDPEHYKWLGILYRATIAVSAE
jgi:hypothetical protein